MDKTKLLNHIKGLSDYQKKILQHMVDGKLLCYREGEADIDCKLLNEGGSLFKKVRNDSCETIFDLCGIELLETVETKWVHPYFADKIKDEYKELVRRGIN